jgi:RecA/RadA recombinase
MERRKPPKKELEHTSCIASTGSTLLDLAISGGAFKRGGLPGGILVEIFGPTSTGKTVLLSEIAGGIQRRGGEVRFCDPEGRLNKQFALLFGLDIDTIEYSTPDTISKVFKPIREWKPDPLEGVPHGVFADSLTALTTEMELEDKDMYGTRRAKEFSEQLRKVCRSLVDHNILLVCSNQVRQNINAGPFEQKYYSPGGEAIGFYSSVRLRTSLRERMKKERKIRGREHSAVIGVKIDVQVFKNSVWAPYHTAPVHIRFDYGIDDVAANLQYIKTNMKMTKYGVGDMDLYQSLEQSATAVEEDRLERQLRDEVIALWNEIEDAFSTGRKKRRT